MLTMCSTRMLMARACSPYLYIVSASSYRPCSVAMRAIPGDHSSPVWKCNRRPLPCGIEWQETSSGSVHSGMAVATIYMTAAFSAQCSATRRRLDTNLVSQLTPVVVFWIENLVPEFQPPSFDEIPSLLLEHRVVIGHCGELLITEAFCICNIGQ